MVEITSSKDLSKIVRDLRKKAYLSQERLTELSGVSRTAIQTLESGKNSCQIDTILKVLKVLNVHIHLSHPLIQESQSDD